MTYRVEDRDAADDTLNFTIAVQEPDTAPSFGGQTVADQTFTEGRTAWLRLPEATGGNAPLAGAFFLCGTCGICGTGNRDPSQRFDDVVSIYPSLGGD